LRNKKKHQKKNLKLIIDDTYSKEEFDKIIEDLMEQA